MTTTTIGPRIYVYNFIYVCRDIVYMYCFVFTFLLALMLISNVSTRKYGINTEL